MASGMEDEPNDPLAGSREGLVTMPFPKFNRTDVALTEDEVRVNVEIKATSSAAVREGLDLVAVLDVSGSMKGPRIESAKRALQFVIMKLTPLDRLCIVTFNSTAKLITPLRKMTPDAQDELKRMVGRLTHGGGTDIKSGLVMGLDVLGSRQHTESRTANIFLMSDGENQEPNSGDPKQVDPGNVVVYTFGFGSGKHHELLTDLAKNSTGGTYNSVPDDSNLSTSFAQLLAGLLTVVAQDVRLTLKPNKGLDLQEMTVADGSDYEHIPGPNGLITILFGNLFSGEVRTVAVDFKLKDRSNERSDFVASLAEAEFSYASQGRRQIPRDIRINRKRKSSPRHSTDLEQRSVEAETIRRKHAKTIREVTDLAKAKQIDPALKMLQAGQNTLMEIKLDDGGKMADVLSAELLQLEEYMATQETYDDLGHPYALATILSHGRQRAAGRGFEEEVLSLYVTPRMVVYIKQVKIFEKNPDKPVPSAEEDVKQEALTNPLAAIAGPLGFYLEDAIYALQAIQKILAHPTNR